jgi:3-deoxy-D-manno-oct-2-ulosonic acid (Kdo) hydroxylase
MDEGIVLQLPVEQWDGPITPEIRTVALTALEAGRVLVLPHLPFALREPERQLLSANAADNTRKNISFDPATGTAHGTTLAGEEMTRLKAMLDRFAHQTETLIQNLFPSYAPALERARTSFRPAEIAGRAAPPRKDDKRLHVDAFPTRPMRGRRILRVFSNIAPDGTPRVWRLGEPFPDFAAKFFPRLRPSLPGQGWIMAQLGLTKGRRTPYDFLMLGLHDTSKLDAEYQARAPATEIAFPPGTTWLCFSDSVLHAATAGRFALEQTFHIPVEAMAHPELAPLRVLESLAGRPLA